jgi:hypothetical protein
MKINVSNQLKIGEKRMREQVNEQQERAPIDTFAVIKARQWWDSLPAEDKLFVFTKIHTNDQDGRMVKLDFMQLPFFISKKIVSFHKGDMS